MGIFGNLTVQFETSSLVTDWFRSHFLFTIRDKTTLVWERSILSACCTATAFKFCLFCKHHVMNQHLENWFYMWIDFLMCLLCHLPPSVCRQNEVLWREVVSLRQNHTQQQKVMNKVGVCVCVCVCVCVRFCTINRKSCLCPNSHRRDLSCHRCSV